MKTCRNCNHKFDGNFCSNCGQPAETGAVDAHFLWQDIQHGLLHYDKGILYSAKQLATRPGHTVREFIEGKRIRHFRPISMVIILATFYGLLYHSFDINLMTNASLDEETKSEVDLATFNEWAGHHFAWITLTTIPLYTLGTYLCFRNQGYNFTEFLILNSFKASQRLLVHIGTFPLLYLFNGTSEIKTFTSILYVIDIALIYWTNLQFFNKLTKIKVLLLSALSHIIFVISLSLLIGFVILFIEFT